MAEAQGAAAVSLHARTAAQLYDPPGQMPTLELLKLQCSHAWQAALADLNIVAFCSPDDETFRIQVVRPAG